VTALRLAFFIGALTAVGLLIVPRLLRALVRWNKPETTLVASLGICFACALLAHQRGYSVALGAFIAGSLIAESGEGKVIEKLVQPVRDMFAAVFFVAVGMMIDPGLIEDHWAAVVMLTVVVILGKVIAVTLSTFMTGRGIHASVQTGMSLAQIGEFSFIIAGVGLATGAIRPFLYPVAVAVSAITTLSTPWLIRASGPVATLVDRKLPRPLQTFAALYGSWMEGLRRTRGQDAERARIRRRVGWMLVDTALLAAIVIGISYYATRVRGLVSGSIGLSPGSLRLLEVAGALAASIPLVIGVIRSARFLGHALALRAMPAAEPGRVDLADAPRRALVVTLQLALMGLVVVPLAAITQPFLPAASGPIVLAVLLVLLFIFGIAFWRSATNLQGHARAGAEMILEVLASQIPQAPAAQPESASLAPLHSSLPGLGEPVCVRLEPGFHAVDHTLAALNVRGLTGATVLAIQRSSGHVTLPSGHESLRSGDVLVLAGTQDSVDAAAQLLRGRGGPGGAGLSAPGT
jgi:CPA2 family monovalent cation:H+ antiporter-2